MRIMEFLFGLFVVGLGIGLAFFEWGMGGGRASALREGTWFFWLLSFLIVICGGVVCYKAAVAKPPEDDPTN